MIPGIETLTVNAVVREYPATAGVFNQFGVDACCGGGSPVAEAAEREGVDLSTLLSALQAAIDGSPYTAGVTSGARGRDEAA